MAVRVWDQHEQWWWLYVCDDSDMFAGSTLVTAFWSVCQQTSATVGANITAIRCNAIRTDRIVVGLH